MKNILFCIALVGVAGFAGAASVLTVTEAPTIDGRLDEAVWAKANWEGGFKRFSHEKRQPAPSAATEFAILADAENLYLGMKATHGRMDELKAVGSVDIWNADGIEFYFIPDGAAFEFYQFLVTWQGTTHAAFHSEGGGIEPDPYGPMWERKVTETEKGWCAEARIPLSAFYMTRGSAWRRDWKVNVCRTYRDKLGSDFSCWIDGTGYKDLKHFKTVTGFPLRKPSEDVWIKSVVPTVRGKKDGKITGSVKIAVYSEEPGPVTVESPFTDPFPAKLGRRGDVEFEIPARFPENGRLAMPIRLVRPNAVCERTYPVIVDYRALRLDFTKPSYRSNFYPGQNSDTVAGRIVSSVPGEVTAVLEGPGFGRREARLAAGGGAFSFDTKGFADGTALLTVTAGGETLTRKIRKLAPLGNGRHVSWIENGHLVVDGKPVLRRNIYAEYYLGGKAFRRKYDADDLHMTKFVKEIATLEPLRLVKGIEAREATKDVKPSADLLAKADERIDAGLAKSDGVFYYICDEPECRKISPVYLRHYYEHISERDPYHVILSCSRAGEKYIDCADWFETHPYINAHYDTEGNRIYGRAFNEIGDFISAFHPENHPDKCVGGTGTCFSYGGTNGDYPTFREYVANAWCEFLRGAKTLFPYAYHDLGDRASLYEGTRYLFTSAEALEEILLKGTRQTLVKTGDYEAALWTMPDGEKMFCVQNFTTKPLAASVPGLSGAFREFRGTRSFNFGSQPATFDLQPLESLVATTKRRDAGLMTYAETQAQIDAVEKERTSRDNQMLCREPESLGRCPAFEVTTSSGEAGRQASKIFDGTRDTLAWYQNWCKDAFYEIAFPGMVPVFSELTVYGSGLETMVVKIRSAGEWTELKPASVESGEFFRRLVFDRTHSAVKLRLEFPKVKSVELYEIELPGKGRQPAPAGTHAPLVVTRPTDYFSRAYPAGAATNVSFSVRREPGQKYLTFELRSARRVVEKKYTAWNLHFWKDELAGQVSYPIAGLYTLRIPDYAGKRETLPLLFRSYNLALDIGDVVCSREPPANRVEFVEQNGLWTVRVTLADRCEDIACPILHDRGLGPEPFLADGKASFDLKPTDADCRVWVGTMPVPASGLKRDKRGNRPRPFVKVTVLGGAIRCPILSGLDFAGEGKTVAYDLHTKALTPIVEEPKPAGGPMTFVRNGELKFAIVVDKDAEKGVRHADDKSIAPALEVLLAAFEKTTGKRPAVLDENETEKIAAYDWILALGDGRYARAAGIDRTKLKEDGFAIRTFGKGLAIAGFDSSLVPNWVTGPLDRHRPVRGTFFGALDFTERFLGCRYYYPGEYGSVFPPCRDLAIAPVAYADAPEFANRGIRWFIYCSFENDRLVEKWRRYLGPSVKKRDTSFDLYYRSGGPRRQFGSHSPEVRALAKAYPDRLRDIFYTSPDGGKFWYNPKAHIGNYYDVTNLKFADLLVDAYKTYYASNGKDDRGIGKHADINDVSFGVCDTYIAPLDLANNETVKRLGLIPEAERANPTRRSLRNVYGRFFQYLGNEMKRELPDKKLWLLLYYDSRYAPDDPQWRLPDNIAANLCLYNLPRQTRNPAGRAEDLQIAKEWYEARGGRPAEEIWLYTSLNNRFARAIIPEFTAEVPKVLGKYLGRDLMFMDYNGGADLWHYFWAPYVCHRAMWNSNLDVDAAIDEMWPLLFGKAAPHMREFHRVLKKAYLDHIMPSQETVPQLPLAVIEAMERALAAAKAALAPGSVEMRRYEMVADYWPDAFRTQRARAAYRRPVYDVARFGGEAPDWSAVPTMPLFDPLGADTRAEPVSVKFAWNDRGLYGRFESARAPKADEKSDLWHNDTIEFFPCPGTDGAVEHQLAWDPLGREISLRHRFKPMNLAVELGWRAAGSWCRSSRLPTGWTADFFVPFADLGAAVPADGALWNLNFVYTGRGRGKPDVVRGNSLTLGNHHLMDMYGRVRFAGRPH